MWVLVKITSVIDRFQSSRRKSTALAGQHWVSMDAATILLGVNVFMTLLFQSTL
jgi:hypothetical protein